MAYTINSCERTYLTYHMYIFHKTHHRLATLENTILWHYPWGPFKNSKPSTNVEMWRVSNRPQKGHLFIVGELKQCRTSPCLTPAGNNINK